MKILLLLISIILVVRDLASGVILPQTSATQALGYGDSDSFVNGERELLRDFLKPSFIVFDVGANEGDWTAIALESAPVSVFAFEPIPELYRELKSRHLRKAFKAFNCALADIVGSTDFYYYDSRRDSSVMSGLYERDILKNQLPPPKKITVPLTTIDYFCKIHGISQIDLLKIDTEGAEYKILQGASNLLQNHKIRAIQFEYGGTYLDANTTLHQVATLLTDRGYVLFRIIPEGLVHIAAWEQSLENFTYSNYFAICQEDMKSYSLCVLQ